MSYHPKGKLPSIYAFLALQSMVEKQEAEMTGSLLYIYIYEKEDLIFHLPLMLFFIYFNR